MSYRKPVAPTDDQPGFDLRLQNRFVTKGHWVIESISDAKDGLVDSDDNITEFSLPQPAIGLFSDEELVQVQANFPYRARLR